MPYSVDQIIPPLSELALMLEQWGEETDSSIWKIANVTNDLIDELVGFAQTDEGPLTKAQLYRAVALRAKGKRPDTVRRWAECAKDFPPESQQKYAQLLSFDHFKVARRLARLHDMEPDYFLEWAITAHDGRFASTNEMLANFLKSDGDLHPAQRWFMRAEQRMLDVFMQWPNQEEVEELMYCAERIKDILDKDKK